MSGKACSECGETKPLSEFYMRETRSGGRDAAGRPGATKLGAKKVLGSSSEPRPRVAADPAVALAAGS